jgi:hypothetical protein
MTEAELLTKWETRATEYEGRQWAALVASPVGVARNRRALDIHLFRRSTEAK